MSEAETQEKENVKSELALKVKELQLDEGWPCKADILERSKEIENLTPVILNVDAPIVFAIDAPWGGGKTTFIRLWQHYLSKEQNGAVSLYFNAWENDFSDDPLLPMLAEFDDWLSAKDSNATQLWNKTKSLLPGLLKRGTIVAAKVATLGGLDLEKETEKLASDFAGDTANDLVDGFKSHKSILENFKKNLGKLTQALPEGQKNLIVFVDELDRCRPTYAIETLERIKHLFDIPNIVFVLAVNKEQLAKSIQGVYGNNFDGLNYLKRFIDMEYSLRIPPTEKYVVSFIREDGIGEYFVKSKELSLQFVEGHLSFLVEKFELQMRDIQQFLCRLRLILLSLPHGHPSNLVLLSTLLVYRHCFYDDYKIMIISKNVSPLISQICNFSFRISRSQATIVGKLILDSTYDKPTEREALLEDWLTNKNSLSEAGEGEFVRNIRHIEDIVSEKYGSSSWGDNFKVAVERAELASSLNFVN